MAAAEAAIVGTYQTRCILKASAGFVTFVTPILISEATKRSEPAKRDLGSSVRQP